MITNYKFQIIPSQILYPELPFIELYVRKKVTGLFWTEEEYTWSCLPGYSRENMGVISVSDLTRVGGKGYSFYLYSRPLDPDEKAANPCYGILSEIPKNFSVGSQGAASFHYSGAKVKDFLDSLGGKYAEAVPYADWKLLNVY
jgi:hypothetical protein